MPLNDDVARAEAYLEDQKRKAQKVQEHNRAMMAPPESVKGLWDRMKARVR